MDGFYRYLMTKSGRSRASWRACSADPVGAWSPGAAAGSIRGGWRCRGAVLADVFAGCAATHERETSNASSTYTHYHAASAVVPDADFTSTLEKLFSALISPVLHALVLHKPLLIVPYRDFTLVPFTLLDYWAFLLHTGRT